MKSLKINYLLLLVLSVIAGGLRTHQNTRLRDIRQFSDGSYVHCSNDSTCPTWFTCNSDNKCQCENSANDGIICDNDKLLSAQLVCYCVTYNEESRSTYVGSCFYNCENFNATIKNDLRRIYHYLPRNPEKLINHSACTHFHRTGLLCGDCEVGYSPLVLSYNLSCVPCPSGQRNWWKFALAGFVPLTLFYLFVVVFHVNVTSSRLHGVVWVSQVVSMPAFIRIALFALEIHGNLTIGKISLIFYSYSNLDFFQSVLPNICLNVTTLQALAMEYLIALYPFMLIFISYFTIALYDRKIPFLVYAWKPFQKLQSKVQTSWDVRTSVIDSFSTFFLLSYVKVLSVTCDVLIPTQVQQLGSNERQLVLYYSPSIPYFGDFHRPYAILAITILTIFVIIPTIIFILYPCNFFQRFLSLFPINWHFLHAFVDSFQGCYKNGTESGTLDCRWFSVITLIIRPLLFVIFGLTLSAMYFAYALVVLLILMIALVNIQPYKKTPSNYPPTDLMFHFLLGLFYIALLGREQSTLEIYLYFHTMWVVVSIALGFVPITYTCFLIGLWCFSKRKRIICR